MRTTVATIAGAAGLVLAAAGGAVAATTTTTVITGPAVSRTAAPRIVCAINPNDLAAWLSCATQQCTKTVCRDSSQRVSVGSLRGAAPAVDTAARPVSVPSEPHSPVTVTVSNSGGGTQVEVTLEGRPLVGASTGSGRTCVGVSYQVPVCAVTPQVVAPRAG
ncbi:MAG TPA: hypothetical protein VNG13_08305 [Mycobacteriales bacterium]|nr:hypothetical protein [Mycobacteriales bacterium]